MVRKEIYAWSTLCFYVHLPLSPETLNCYFPVNVGTAQPVSFKDNLVCQNYSTVSTAHLNVSKKYIYTLQKKEPEKITLQESHRLNGIAKYFANNLAFSTAICYCHLMADSLNIKNCTPIGFQVHSSFHKKCANYGKINIVPKQPKLKIYVKRTFS